MLELILYNLGNNIITLRNGVLLSMRIRKVITNLILSILSIFFLTGNSVRAEELIAIVGTDAKAMNKADMVIAKGTENKLKFVERDQLNKVIAEQKLTLSGMVNTNSLFKVSKLLGADIIAQIIGGANSRIPDRIIIFNAKTGVRLEDRFLSNKGFDNDIVEILEILNKALYKDKARRYGKVKNISFIPINMISDDKKILKSTTLAQIYLKQKLLSQKEIVLLERDLVDLLIEEKLINPDILRSLKRCNFAVELEAKFVDSKKDKISLAAFIKNRKGDIKNEVIKIYVIEKERQTAKEIAESLINVISGKEESKQTDENAEAKVFLEDSEYALKSHNYSKSFLSLKNAYMLNPKLKPQINKIIRSNITFVNQQKYEIANFGNDKNRYKKIIEPTRLLINLLNFYHKINGHYFRQTFWFNFFYYYPEDIKNQIREYRHKYFMEKLGEIKRKYDYKKYPKGSKEYFVTYTKYLGNLVNLTGVSWTGEYQETYLEADVIEYIKEVSELDDKKRSEFTKLYLAGSCTERLFCNSDGIVSPESFNRVVDICQLAFNSPVIKWKQETKKILKNIREIVISQCSDENDPFYSYHKDLNWNVNSSRLTVAGTGISDYQFMKLIALKGIGASRKKRIECEAFLNNNMHVYRNNKLDTEIFEIALRAKYSYTIMYFLKGIQENPASPFLKDREKYKVPKITQLKQLREIAVRYKANNTIKEIDKRIALIVAEQKNKEYLAKKTDSRKIFKVYKNVLTKERAKTRLKGMYSTAGMLRENNIVYFTLRRQYFHHALVKIDLNKNFTTVVGKDIVTDNTGDSSYVHGSFCMSPKYIIEFNAFAGIILYPKDGSKPELIKDKLLHNRLIYCIYNPNGKVYFISQNTSDTKKKRPFEIIELDLETKVRKLIYSAGQEKDNPFKVLPSRFFIDKMILEPGTNNLIIVTYLKGTWQFNIASGKWKELPPSCCYNYDAFMVKGLFVSRDGRYFILWDYSKNGTILKEFAKTNKLEKIHPGGNKSYYMRIRMKALRNNKIIYPNYLNFTDKNFWDGDKIIFFKQRMIFYFEKTKATSIFRYKGKLYGLFSMLNDEYTLKVDIGIFKDSEQFKKSKNKENSIVVESF